MKRLALALCLTALAAPALDAQVAPAAATSSRRRVAVLDFDYGTVHSYVTGIMGSDVDIGKGVAIMLVSKLAQNGAYTVMERAQLDRVLNEQNFQQDSRADVSSAAKLGRLLGVDAIIIGSITQFQREDKNISLGMRRESKATVAIDARIVQIGTGEILAVAQGKGQSKRAHFTSQEEDRARDLRGQDMWSSNLASTLLGDCVGACPLAPGGTPPEQKEAQREGPAPASSPPSGGSVGARPAAYAGPVSGSFTWSGYSFKSTEHFHYDAFVNVGGQSQTGFYELDASDAGGGRTQLRVQGQMGKHPISATIILAPNEGLSGTQMAQLGPAAMALFSPSYAGLFTGHPWVVGEGWSSNSSGQSSGFKVESTCQYAGVQGLRGVMRQNDQILMDLCIAPNVGLPLAVTTGYGSGATGYSYALKLTQYRP